MRLEVPFIYRQLADYPRGKPEWSALFRDNLALGSTEVDIRELSADEAPVVLEAERARDHGPLAVRYHDGQFLTTNRLSSDRLVGNHDPVTSRMLSSGAFSLCLPRSVVRDYELHPLFLAYRFERGHLFGASTSATSALRSWLNGEGRDAPAAKAVAWDRLEEDRAAAVEACGRLALIGGEVWFPIAEPRLALCYTVNGAFLNIFEDNGGYGSYDFEERHVDVIDTREFRADDQEAVEAALARRPAQVLTNYALRLRVLMPDVLSFDAARSDLMRSAQMVLHQTFESAGRMDDGDLSRWAAFRSRYRAALDDWSDAAGDAIHDDMMHFAPFMKNRKLARGMDALSVRWQEREISPAAVVAGNDRRMSG